MHTFSKIKEKDEPLQDSSEVVIYQVFITGNKTTKEKVIRRELQIKAGDTIFIEHLDELIEKSKDNLFNTSLFNYITINTIAEDNLITLYVLVEERWYLWPYLIFEQADRNLSAFLHNQDWSRINYGLMVVKRNFRGRGETIKFKFRAGYKEQFQIGYEVPYLGRYRQHGLASEFSWNRQHEIPYLTQTDDQIYFKDEQSFVTKYNSIKLTYQYRQKFYTRHNFSIAYNYARVLDTVIQLNPNYFGNGQNNTQYFTLSYNFSLDKRNYKHYPTVGYNFDATLSQKSLELLPNSIDGIWALESQAFYYKGFTDRWFTGFGASGKISSPRKQPYAIEQGLGFGTSLRAFEYNVIDGQSFITGRAFLKYAIIPLKIYYIESWGWTKFNKIHYSLFTNIFFDSGYVYDISPDPSNKLPNNYLSSMGVGIDLVAYYDIILRFEYSINRFGQHGFFLNIGKAF